MQQKTIRNHNGQTYTVQEASDIFKELNNRTQSDKEGYNSLDDLGVKVENLENNQYSGVKVYALLSELPSTGEVNISYKVTNDPVLSNNGYYYWNGSGYNKEAEVYNGEVDKTNTSEPVVGRKIHDFTLEKVNTIVSTEQKEDISEQTSGKYWSVTSGNIVEKTGASFTKFEKVFNVVGLKYVLIKGILNTVSGSSLLGVLTAGGIHTTIPKTTTPKYNNNSDDRIVVLPNDAEEVRLSVYTSDLSTVEVYLCEYEPEEFIEEDYVLNPNLITDVEKRLLNKSEKFKVLDDLSKNTKNLNILEGVELKRATKISAGNYSLDNTKISTEFIDVLGYENKVLRVSPASLITNVTYMDDTEAYIGYKSSTTWKEVNDVAHVILPHNARYVVISGTPDYTLFRNSIKASFYSLLDASNNVLKNEYLENLGVKKEDLYETYQISTEFIDGVYYIKSGNNVIFSNNSGLSALIADIDVTGRKSIIVTGIPDTFNNVTTGKFIAIVILENGDVVSINQYYDSSFFGTDGLKFNLPANTKEVFIYVNIADSGTAKVYVSNSDILTVIDEQKLRSDVFGVTRLLEGKKLNSEGDSITFREFWQPYVIEQTGLILTNTGIGSTKLAGTGGTGLESMCQTTRINAVKSNDPDFLTIMGGTNDRGANIPIGNHAEMLAKDTSTFKGAYSHIIDQYLTWKPSLKIIMMTPPHNHGGANNNGDTIIDFAKATKEVAEYYGIPCVDVNANSGINEYTLNYLTSDGVHPNDAGARRISNLVISELLKNIYN